MSHIRSSIHDAPLESIAATLACLPDMTPQRLRNLVERFGCVRAALEAVRSGQARSVIETTRTSTAAARVLADEWRSAVDVAREGLRLARRGTHVWIDGTPGYPIRDAVPDRPVVLLGEGARPDVMDRRRVAVVGTRAATPHGRADAYELGAFLADQDITVVSGLAIGIDAAAHEGALDAGGGVVGVVATGLDVEYPRRHGSLYRRVRSAGIVVGETGYGVGPTACRFPVRNRIIAALADAVVVVEATRTGGARITAQFALEYGRPLLAMPGSRRNPAAEGANALIADGAHPLLEWTDVLVALSLSATDPGARAVLPARAPLDANGRAVLGALGGEPATPDDLVERTGLGPARIGAALATMARHGWVQRDRGWYWPI